MQLPRFITIGLSFMLLLSTAWLAYASDDREETNQGEEADFYISDNDLSLSPSGVVYLNDVVEIKATVTRDGDESSINWTKEGLNLAPGGGGGEENVHLISPRVMLDNGTYKMWYGGTTSGKYRIFYATSADGDSWTKQGMVLDTGLSGDLDDTHVAYHWVVKEGGTYKMWYSGADNYVGLGGRYRIFYATSPDGVNWTKQGLLIDVGVGGSTDSRTVRSPTIIKESGVYKMWYVGANDGLVDRIHYATSPDGIGWSKQGVVLDLGQPGELDEDGAGFPFVSPTTCGYRMWYGGIQSGTFRILSATSADGLVWEREGLVLDIGPGPEESRIVDHFILFNGSMPERMWYAGLDTNYQIFTASANASSSVAATVAVYIDEIQPANLITEQPEVQFNPCVCSTRNVYANWTASPLGVHEIIVVVDPEDNVTESNEANNTARQGLVVISPTIHADAGPDQQITEGETVHISGNGSSGSVSFAEWIDSFDDASKISQSVNTTISMGSVVLENVSLRIMHTFDTDPGFTIEDDMPNTVIWWSSSRQAIQWYVDREDPQDHYEKLIDFLPYPITDAMDIRTRVDYLYWQADSYSVADPLILQKNTSWRLGQKWGPTNNTLIARVYGGDLMQGNLDRLPAWIFDDSTTMHEIYTIDYDGHYWELFTTRMVWDSESRMMYGEVKDSLDVVVTNGTISIDESFTFEKYGVGSYGEGNIDGNPHIGEGFADNMSISADGYKTPGSVVSTVVDPGANLSNWVSFNMSTIEPPGTDVKVDILNETGVPLVEGIDAIDCPVNLLARIDPLANPVLRLRATLTTDRNETPALLEWSLNYTTSPSVDYEWDINHLVDGNTDGNFTNDVDFTGRSIDVTYGDNGVYEVHLTVRDQLGNVSVDSCNVTVLNADPSISFTPPSSPEEGISLDFNASVVDPGSDDVTFLWDWGDGSNGSWTYYNDGMGPDPPNSPDVNPMMVAGQWTHTYGHGGPYTVNLTVVDDDGGSNTVLYQLDVSNIRPTVALDVTDPNPVVEGSPVLLGGYFDDPSWLDNHTVTWAFGDGQSMQGSFAPGVGFTHHVVDNVTHFYGDDGVFQVTLNVSDEYGDSDEASVAITVFNQNPSANINCPSKVSVGNSFQCFTNATDPGSDDLTVDWNWDDGTAHNMTIYYNNGVSPDPYPSPGPVYPFSTDDLVTHAYSSVGNYTVVLNITDDDGGYIELQFDIEVVGPPETAIVIGNPQYVSADFFITSSTPISFIVWDRSGTGIESTYYRVGGGTWTLYVSPFTIPDEGARIIYFNSTDMLGGAEPTKNFSLIVDNTPPSSTIAVGTPNYTGVDLWIAPSTPLTITSIDIGCGLSQIEYELDGGGWQTYLVPITVPAEGSHVLLYRGIDNLGNTEIPQSLTFWVDGTPPVSSIIVGTPNYTSVNLWISPSTTLEIVSADSGSGLSYVEYDLDGGGWLTYAVPIMVPAEGAHVLLYRGVDNLGFIENQQTLNFWVDATPPYSDIFVGIPNYTGIDLWIAPSTQLTIISNDDGSGISLIEYELDGGGWQAYIAPITVPAEGSHVLLYRGIDNLGYTESPSSLTFIVDGSPPSSSVTIGTPNYTGVDLWISPSTPITISSTDGGCGLSLVGYQLDGGGWQTYTVPITVPTEGSHLLLYRGIDNLGITEDPGSLVFWVDATAPISDVTVGTPSYTGVDLWISPTTTLEISSADAGSGVSQIEYQLDGGGWQTYVAPITVPAEGTHFLVYRGVDNLGFVEDPKSLVFIVDGTPPSSDINVGSPSFTAADLWISPSTPVTLSSTDGGCGLSYVEYQIDGGGWQTYTVPIVVTQEGSHVLLYRGVDNLGNVETEGSLDFIVDGTPPSSNETIGSPNYTWGGLWIAPSTSIEIQSQDQGCGLSEIEFSLDGGGWQTYTGPLTMQFEGAHTLSYRGVDNLGNIEEANNLDLLVDGTPPSSWMVAGQPNYTAVTLWISPLTPLSITSGDDGCGLSHIEYRLDTGTWQNYTTAITVQIEGSHTISYRGVDNLGNVEVERLMSFIVDGTPPASSIGIGEPRNDVTPVEVYQETPFTISSVDAGSGVRVIEYRIDYGAWYPYTGSFNLTGRVLGIHTIEFRAYDNLDNSEEVQSITVDLVEPAAQEENLKPLIAIVFAIVLAIIGALLALKRPFISEKGKEKRAFTFLAVALPFVLAEIFTGISSLFVPAMEVPPWFGLGMIVDLAILAAGLVVEMVVFAKNKGPEEEEEEPESDVPEETD